MEKPVHQVVVLVESGLGSWKREFKGVEMRELNSLSEF